MQKELVEERIVKRNRTVYAITQRGVTVLKYFGELKQMLPIVEENQRPVPPFF
jgi:predicted transcriptional regulator